MFERKRFLRIATTVLSALAEIYQEAHKQAGGMANGVRPGCMIEWRNR